MKIITVTEDINLKSEFNIPIVIISIVLMFIGTIVSSALPQYKILDFLPSVFLGALISIVGNMILLYGQKDKLIKTKIAKIGDSITMKDEVTYELKWEKKQSK